MRISIRVDNKAAQAQLCRQGGEFREKVQKAVARGIISEAVELKEDVYNRVAGQMAVVKESFVEGFTTKVLNRDRSRLPALYVDSHIPWSSIHERGGIIGDRMPIPPHGHVGCKHFRAQAAELIRGGDTYFIKNAKRNITLMVENIREHDRPLSGFKRCHRRVGGVKRLKRGADMPIAALVPRVQLKRRLNVKRIAAAHTPRPSTHIEKQLWLVD